MGKKGGKKKQKDQTQEARSASVSSSSTSTMEEPQQSTSQQAVSQQQTTSEQTVPQQQSTETGGEGTAIAKGKKQGRKQRQQQQQQQPPSQQQQQQQQQPPPSQQQQQQQQHPQQQQQQQHPQQQQQQRPQQQRQQQPQQQQQQQPQQQPPSQQQQQQQQQPPPSQQQQQPQQHPQQQQQQQHPQQQQQQPKPWGQLQQQQQQQPQQQQQQPQQQRAGFGRGQYLQSQQQQRLPPQQQQWQPPQQQQPWRPPHQQQQQQPQQQRKQQPQQQQWQQPQQQQQQPRQPPQQQQQQRQQQPQQQRQQPWRPPHQQQQQQSQHQQQKIAGLSHGQYIQHQQQQQPQPPPGQQPQPQHQPTGGGQAQQPAQGPSVQQQQQAGATQELEMKVARLFPSTPSSKLIDEYFRKIPVRRNPTVCGTQGRRIVVETNMFSLDFGQNFANSAVHYDVEITFKDVKKKSGQSSDGPKVPKSFLRVIFEECRKKNFPKRYPAYDGRKNAYSATNLPFGDSMSDDITIYDPERAMDRNFRIELKKVALIDLSWLKTTGPGMLENSTKQTSIQALDIILRHGPTMHNIPIGRSIFQQNQPRVVSLSNGLDLWVGMFQSAVLGWKPYLNIDVAHKGFHKSQNVIDLMKDLCLSERDRGRMLQPNDINRNRDKIEKYLKGLKVQYEIPNQPTSRRTHRVNGLVACPRDNKFSLSNDAGTCTVEQYFSEVKHYRIQYPLFPCLWVGSREKKIYVPPELCNIVAGQPSMKKLDPIQTSKMIKSAATSTIVRKQKIMDAFAEMNINNNNTMRDEFGLSIQGKFEKVPARVLDPPQLVYERPTRVSRGVWRTGRFTDSRKLEDNSWTILNLNNPYTRENELHDFQSILISSGNIVGMDIGKAQTPFISMSLDGNISRIMNYFEEKKKNKLKLVIVVIPELADVYNRVKQVTELRIGILTQCVKGKTLKQDRDRLMTTVGNILLKINSKLNGINHLFQTSPRCLREPCMLIGADVTHPSPDAVNIPSIAAVAASNDPKAFRYNIEVRLQPPRMEIIQELEDIVRLQLIFFYKTTRQKPVRIVFYRDGVSEGQLVQVMQHELEAVRRAVLKLNQNVPIPITFLVVQKRHHVRLFPTDERNSDDARRNFNVQAGTIVDTNITHPSHIDFYLVSHASIQGTARPTKYRCICNENDMTEDEIEQLTYYLCHMFARCTRSVSYPAPTYYAHLAAYRARALIYQEDIMIDNLQEEQRRKLTIRMNKDETPMFFV